MWSLLCIPPLAAMVISDLHSRRINFSLLYIPSNHLKLSHKWLTQNIKYNDNQYINNTPEIIYLTNDNYDSYFTDNILNYKHTETELPYTHIIINSDLYKNDGEIFKELKTRDFRTLKDCLGKLSLNKDKHETLKNEFVKWIVSWKCMYSVCITYQRFRKAPFYAVCKSW